VVSPDSPRRCVISRLAPNTSAKNLQIYLDEFTFRHNRRRTPMAAFQTLLGLSAVHRPTTSAQITAT